MSPPSKDISSLPAHLRPYAADELERVERRSRILRNRFERFFGPAGLCAAHERIGDELIELAQVYSRIADVAGITPQAVVRAFRATTQQGAFPRPGTGFRPEPDRRAIRGLLDLHSIEQFLPGQYPLQPSLSTIEAAPLTMRARRSTWVQWIEAQGWKVPPELKHSLTIEHEAAPPTPAASDGEDTAGADRALAWMLKRSREQESQGKSPRLKLGKIQALCIAETGATQRDYRAACGRLPSPKCRRPYTPRKKSAPHK